jgi:hypothetical protein
MSSLINALTGIPDDDPREVELVRNLLDKTREGKIRWIRQGSAFTASVANGLQVHFVLGSVIFGARQDWQLFTVRDAQGAELIKFSSPPLFAVVTANTTNPLLTAINDLYRAVRDIVGDSLERAIDAVRRL